MLLLVQFFMTVMIDLVIIGFWDVGSGQTNVNILPGLLVSLNKAPQADHMGCQLLVVHGACTPQIPSPFGGLVLVLFGPCVFTPSKRIGDRVRTSSRGPLLLVVFFLLFSPLLCQPPLGLTLAGLL